MGLKQIILPPETLVQLYTSPIINLQPADKSKPAKEQTDTIKYLGSNKKNISILVKSADAPFLNDQSFNFLAGILNACKLNMADVALINISSAHNTGYTAINSITNPEKTILFDVSSLEISLPMQFPYFQVQRFNNVMYLSAPSLNIIEDDKAIKAQLWASLKQLFQL
ncbi:MAG: hypothetical protein IT249_14335 [Chitinophagaceae bacterium]|nr:hypothetical protein [Chitinophagaceae bacterium]